MFPMENIKGAGIGLRRDFLKEIEPAGFTPGWFEITPENWIHMPFSCRDDFEKIAASFELVAHGVSLSIGSPGDADRQFLHKLKQFLDRYNIRHYSEHISFSSYFGGQSYELLPVPMTEKMATFIAQKIHTVQDILERPVILENPTYYFSPYSEMKESEFINMVLEKSKSPFLLDVNNVYVNSLNHGFNPREFIGELDLDRVAYLHIAGHAYYPEDQMTIDTHGEPLCGEVWELLKFTLKQVNAPVLIERDNNIPPLAELMQEYDELEKVIRSTTSAKKLQREMQHV